MEELKPCPFCGGLASLQIEKRKYQSENRPTTETYFIQCSTCKASSMKVTITEEQRIYADETDITIKTTVDNVIKAWNKRSKDTPKRYATRPRAGMGYDYDDPICPNCGFLICREPRKDEMPDLFYCRECGQLIKMR